MQTFLGCLLILVPHLLESRFYLGPTPLGIRPAILAGVLAFLLPIPLILAILLGAGLALFLQQVWAPSLFSGCILALILKASIQKEMPGEAAIGGGLALLLIQILPPPLVNVLIPFGGGLALLSLLPKPFSSPASLPVFFAAFLPLVWHQPSDTDFGKTLAHYSKARFFAESPPTAQEIRNLKAGTAVFPLHQTPDVTVNQPSPWLFSLIRLLKDKNAFALFESPIDQTVWMVTTEDANLLRHSLLEQTPQKNLPLGSLLLLEKYSFHDRTLFGIQKKSQTSYLPLFSNQGPLPKDPVLTTFWHEFVKSQDERFNAEELARTAEYFLKVNKPRKAWIAFRYAQETGRTSEAIQKIGIALSRAGQRPEMAVLEASRLARQNPNEENLLLYSKTQENLLAAQGLWGLKFDHSEVVRTYDQLYALRPDQKLYLQQSLLHNRLSTLPSLLYDKPGCDSGCSQ